MFVHPLVRFRTPLSGNGNTTVSAFFWRCPIINQHLNRIAPFLRTSHNLIHKTRTYSDLAQNRRTGWQPTTLLQTLFAHPRRIKRIRSSNRLSLSPLSFRPSITPLSLPRLLSHLLRYEQVRPLPSTPCVRQGQREGGPIQPVWNDSKRILVLRCASPASFSLSYLFSH